jgi:hypothetical protein
LPFDNRLAFRVGDGHRIGPSSALDARPLEALDRIRCGIHSFSEQGLPHLRVGQGSVHKQQTGHDVDLSIASSSYDEKRGYDKNLPYRLISPESQEEPE